MWIHILLVVILSVERAHAQTCSNFEDGVDRPGPWYVHVQNMPSAGACCDLCNAEAARCQSWVFVRPGSSAMMHGCYLKQNVPPINEASTCQQYCTSGVRQPSLFAIGRCAYPGGTFELAVDRPGNNYVRLTNVRSHPDCCAMCQIEGDRCQAWTFIRSGLLDKPFGCYLKNAIPPISSAPCVACTSGTK